MPVIRKRADRVAKGGTLAFLLTIGYDCTVKVVTAQTIRELDRRAMTEGGVPGVVLMENAGRAVFEVSAARFGPVRNRAFWVACGTGNNGGDGFVAARYLALAGADVKLTLTGEPDRISGDARIHFDLLRGTGIQPSSTFPLGSTVKIDALLGTGITGAPREEIAAAIDALNRADGPTISVDIPSGVNADTGTAPGAAVRADVTVTFAYPKLGLFLGAGADLSGDVLVDPIGFRWESLDPQTPYELLRAAEMRALLPPRPRDAHKGTFGHVLIVGGSVGMSGAPIMTSRAAARAGCGLVTAAIPRSIQPIVAAGMDELMTIPLPDRDGELVPEAAGEVVNFARSCDAVCLGPGMRNTADTQEFLARVLAELEAPLILDADGLNALDTSPAMLDRRAAPMILTPHPGECGRLIDRTVPQIEEDRIAAVRDAARKYRSVVVLKGARSLICDGRGNAEAPIGINTSGNAGMATGGSGDTLTGILASLVAQGVEPWDAARLGVFIHGRAGDLAAEDEGTRGLIAGDIADRLPAAWISLEWEEF